MSVQCKNCKFAEKKRTKTKCTRWKNGGFVSTNKQRLCDGFVKEEYIEKMLKRYGRN